MSEIPNDVDVEKVVQIVVVNVTCNSHNNGNFIYLTYSFDWNAALLYFDKMIFFRHSIHRI